MLFFYFSLFPLFALLLSHTFFYEHTHTHSHSHNSLRCCHYTKYSAAGTSSASRKGPGKHCTWCARASARNWAALSRPSPSPSASTAAKVSSRNAAAVSPTPAQSASVPRRLLVVVVVLCVLDKGWIRCPIKRSSHQSFSQPINQEGKQIQPARTCGLRSSRPSYTKNVTALTGNARTRDMDRPRKKPLTPCQKKKAD